MGYLDTSCLNSYVAIPGTVYLVSYFKHLNMDERAFAGDKHLVDKVLQDAVKQHNVTKAISDMQALEAQHKFTLPGLSTTILYSIVEIGVRAYNAVLHMRGGTSKEQNPEFQRKYLQDIVSERPTTIPGENSPARKRFLHILDNGKFPTSTEVETPNLIPDAPLSKANKDIKDANKAPKKMARSAMASLPSLAVSSLCDMVETGKNEPDLQILFKKAIVLDNEFLRHNPDGGKGASNVR